MLSFAKYQLTQANSYTLEYLSEDGENKIDQNARFNGMGNTIISICFGISKYLFIHNYIVPGQILGLYETRISVMFTYYRETILHQKKRKADKKETKDKTHWRQTNAVSV